jgi:CheY-like chemotaxis protein
MAEHVLVAVPDLILRAKIRETARLVGRETEVARTPAMALEAAARRPPALVVVDLGDDRIEPFETVRRLKADPATAGSRVVGFYAHVDVAVRDRAVEAGCDRVLPRSKFVNHLARLLETLGAEPV